MLNLFAPPTFQNDLFGSEYITIRPDATIGDSGPIDFIIRGNKEYLDLRETTLNLEVKVVNADGTNILPAVDKDDVAIINNAMHSMFSDVSLYLNDKLVDGGDDLYHLKAYMSTVFKYSEKAQKNQLFAIGFIKDDPYLMDGVKASAFLKRKVWTQNGAIKQFYGKLQGSIFEQERAIPPGVDIRIKLERAKDALALLSTIPNGKPRIEIVKATLNVLQVKVHPSILQEQMTMLAHNTPMIYPVNRIEMHIESLKEKTIGDVKDNLFHGKVPKYIVMAMTSTAAFYGDYTKNPFNFKHYNMESLHLTRDGESVMFEKMEFSFKNEKILKEYMSLYQSNNMLGKNASLPITFEEFQHGYTHFQWNLSDDRQGKNVSAAQTANLCLTFKFEQPTPEPITMIFYGIVDGSVLIYGDQSVVVDGI
jgi:hypothetical protein